MQNKIIGSLIIILLIGFTIFWAVMRKDAAISDRLDILQKKVDSLEIIRDSINKDIVITNSKIKEVHTQYEKDTSYIMHQSLDSNRSYMSNYLEEYSRFLNRINPERSNDN